MNRTFTQIRKLLITGLCICLLIGNILFPSNSALAALPLDETALPAGEYDFPVLNGLIQPPKKPKTTYSPYAGRVEAARGFPQQVFWGDTHLHTVYSFDAGIGGTTLTPEDSYRFARGEEVVTDGGEPVQLSRPLDFLVVSDHTDQLGAYENLLTLEEIPEDCSEEDEEQLLEWYTKIKYGDEEDRAEVKNEITLAFGQGEVPECILQSPEEFRTAWEEIVDWAEEFNDPYKFTALIGYEWTAIDAGDNLHRNVIYRDNGDKATVLLPKTTEDGTDPELLWEWMAAYEDTTGGDVLAIPHNGNLSNGQMFADVDARGMPLNHSYAEQRQRWEPLTEVIQVKGAGETHPYLSPDDEFADFEIAGWDNSNLNMTERKTPDMYEYEYARAALKNGLKFEEDLDVNPFKFGLVGSTDYHISLSAVEEDNSMGKTVYNTPSPDRASQIEKVSNFPDKAASIKRFGWQLAAAGYVGVWAQVNTRESLFDAMARREVYATSGPRMVVRFFGGWDFTEEDLDHSPGDVGYAKGVPMGSDLPLPKELDLDLPEKIAGKAETVAKQAEKVGAETIAETLNDDYQNMNPPTFLVAAMKDPLRANLDRIQIIKGWLDDKGNTREKVYDVTWSDDRLPDPETGKLPPVGSVINPEITDPATDPGTVDTETATWTDTIGDTELATVWTDPDFDPSQRAFYYARVLEIPTPRWTDYDKAFYGKRWCLKEKIAKQDPRACDHIPLTLQERVYTSPIWYSPA